MLDYIVHTCILFWLKYMKKITLERRKLIKIYKLYPHSFIHVLKKLSEKKVPFSTGFLKLTKNSACVADLIQIQKNCLWWVPGSFSEIQIHENTIPNQFWRNPFQNWRQPAQSTNQSHYGSYCSSWKFILFKQTFFSPSAMVGSGSMSKAETTEL